MQIRSYAQLIDLITTMMTNLPGYAVLLGTTPADQDFLQQSLDNLEYVLDYTLVVDDNKKAYTAIKQRLYNGDGGLIPTGPPFTVFSPPETLNGDVSGLLMLLIQRIKGSPNYTHAIGVALGIESSTPLAPVPAEDVLPTIEVFPAQSDYTFSIVVAGREQADSWIVEIMPSGAGGWTNAGTFTGKSADVTITPTTPGQPMQLQVRVQLRKNNANYGQVSAAVTVTVNP